MGTSSMIGFDFRIVERGQQQTYQHLPGGLSAAPATSGVVHGYPMDPYTAPPPSGVSRDPAAPSAPPHPGKGGGDSKV